MFRRIYEKGTAVNRDLPPFNILKVPSILRFISIPFWKLRETVFSNI